MGRDFLFREQEISPYFPLGTGFISDAGHAFLRVNYSSQLLAVHDPMASLSKRWDNSAITTH